MTTEGITEARVRQQAIFFYAVLILWPVYLFLLPKVFISIGGWVILYLIFPGLYLFTWLGYLMHESWHKYVPNVNLGFFYNTFALMILSDPQLYSMLHSTHHGQVNTFNDAEFHPVGEIRSRGSRILYNWLEVMLGVAFLVVVATFSIPRDPRFAKKYRRWKLFVSLLAGVLFYGGLGYLSHLVFGVAVWQVILLFVLCFWLGSFFLHQSQLVEHGNLIVEGTFQQRNLCTRNLKPAGMLEKVFLFLTHNDSREHVLHHTVTNVHSRPFPGAIPLPEKAVLITLGDYGHILGRMLRGEVVKEIAG